MATNLFEGNVSSSDEMKSVVEMTGAEPSRDRMVACTFSMNLNQDESKDLKAFIEYYFRRDGLRLSKGKAMRKLFNEWRKDVALYEAQVNSEEVRQIIQALATAETLETVVQVRDDARRLIRRAGF